MLAFFRNDMGFGGNNGFTDFKEILGFDIAGRRHARRRCSSPRPSRWRSATWRAASSSTRAPASVLLAIRDAESRTRFLGYRVEHYKLVRLRVLGHASPASPARSTCRRSASSTRASSRRSTRSRWSSGSRSAAAARLCGAVDRRGRGQLRQDLADRRAFPRSGSTCWARCSCSSPCSCREGIVGLLTSLGRSAGRPSRMRTRPRPRGRATRTSVVAETVQPASRRHHPLSRRRHRSASTASRRSTISRSYVDRASCGDHRPERRRQDDDDGRHHRQDPAGPGPVLVRRRRST